MAHYYLLRVNIQNFRRVANKFVGESRLHLQEWCTLAPRAY